MGLKECCSCGVYAYWLSVRLNVGVLIGVFILKANCLKIGGELSGYPLNHPTCESFCRYRKALYFWSLGISL